jgi:hypothetical protein
MSTPSAGNFDCARLQEIKVRFSSLVNPNEVKDAEYIPDIAALDLAKATTGFRVPPELQDPTKDNIVKGIWMDDCDDTAPEDCSGDECVIEGDQIGTECKEYELDQCFHKSFSVSERKFRLLGNTVSQDEEVAINLGKKIKLMDEAWATRYIQALDSMAGTNAYTKYTVGGGVTTIPATAWNPDLFSYFAVARSRNKMPGMKLFLGGLMEEALLKAELESETEMGRASARKTKQLGTVYSDSFLTASVIGENAAFLVSNSALALATVARYAPDGAGREEIAQGNKHIYYTIKSPNSGIVYDVTYQRECLASDWINTWDIRSHGAVLTNAVFCEAGRTGVLKFVCA